MKILVHYNSKDICIGTSEYPPPKREVISYSHYLYLPKDYLARGKHEDELLQFQLDTEKKIDKHVKSLSKLMGISEGEIKDRLGYRKL